MKLTELKQNRIVLFVFLHLFMPAALYAQMITGLWKGRINKKKTELKIVQKGDSLLGTSYYYESPNSYRRYSIKGYFDSRTNEAVWWDDQLLEEKKGFSLPGSSGKTPYLSSADFNCPGSGKMFLEGNASLPDDRDNIKGKVALEKTGSGIFHDEWDFIIENYTVGANDPYFIDSVSAIATIPVSYNDKAIINKKPEPKESNGPIKEIEQPVSKPAESEGKPSLPKPVVPIEEKFIKREKIVATEIPLMGDSIELRFYDNAEIDGDSISLFLNNKMIFQHIRLKATAYTIKLPVNELASTNELVMVAENLGSIPPNTSYMLAIVDNKRYEAMLKSTEESSAVIRLVKK